MPVDPWSLLGIAPTAQSEVIRQAFSERLRSMGTNATPNAIEALVNARDRAIEIAEISRASVQSKSLRGGEWRKGHLIFLALFMAAVIGALVIAKYAGILRPIKVDDQLKFPAPTDAEKVN